MRRLHSRVLQPIGLTLALAGLALLAPTASNAAADCPNAEIRAEQGPAALALPDCMAFEMVTPLAKFGETPRYPMISEDGARVAFTMRAALANTPGYQDPIFGDAYVASRTAQGWRTSSLALPREFGARGDFPTADGFTADLTRWISRGATESQNSAGHVSVFESSLTGAIVPRSPVLVPLDGQGGGAIPAETRVVGAADDLSRFVLSPGSTGANGTPQIRYLAGDPTPTRGVDLDARNQYVFSIDGNGALDLELLARDSTGKAWGGNCGAWLGGGQAVQIGRGGRNRGAISSDGKSMFISARAAQPATGACSTTNGIRILERSEGPTGVEVTQMISPECAVPCDSTDGDDLFEGASVDGTKLYFTTTRQLVDSDTDSGPACTDLSMSSVGCDLYLYDSSKPLGDRLTHVSAGTASAGVARNIVGVANDGSRAYFVANAALTTAPNPEGDAAVPGQPNLYAFSAAEGRTSFIATLASEESCIGDACDYSRLYGFGARQDSNWSQIVPQEGHNEQGGQVGGDGHILVFATGQPITADDANAAVDIYRYDDEAQIIERVSKPALGGSDDLPNSGSGLEVNLLPAFPDRTVRNRRVSEDGRTITFASPQALTSDADAGAPNAFLWRLADGGAELLRLPARYSALEPQDIHPSVSLDGLSIAFQTRESLVEQDRDAGGMDIYMARVDGGIARSDDAVSCDVLAGECGEPGADRMVVEPRTALPAGSGNAAQSPRVSLDVRRLSRSARRRASKTGVLRVEVRPATAGRLTLTARARLAGRRRVLGHAMRRIGESRTRVIVAVRLERDVRRLLRMGRSLRVVVEARQGTRVRSISILLPGGGS